MQQDSNMFSSIDIPSCSHLNVFQCFMEWDIRKPSHATGMWCIVVGQSVLFIFNGPSQPFINMYQDGEPKTTVFLDYTEKKYVPAF